eukprot:1394075-Amorphochlora_amoeboformis.AAC.1
MEIVTQRFTSDGSIYTAELPPAYMQEVHGPPPTSNLGPILHKSEYVCKQAPRLSVICERAVDSPQNT